MPRLIAALDDEADVVEWLRVNLEKAVVDRTIDVHVRHIREKLGAASGLVKNIRGVEYKVEE